MARVESNRPLARPMNFQARVLCLHPHEYDTRYAGVRCVASSGGNAARARFIEWHITERAYRRKGAAMKRKTLLVVPASAVFAVIPVVAGWGHDSSDKRDSRDAKARLSRVDRDVTRHSERMIERGRQTFRFDTFGSEAFWGDTLRLHEAIAGA